MADDAAIVISGDRDAYRRQRALGWALIAPLGFIFVIATVSGLVWLAMLTADAIFGTDVGGEVTGARLAILGIGLCCGIPAPAGLAALRGARQLERLRLVISVQGIAREDTPQISMSWAQIQHMPLIRPSAGSRQLLVTDAATAPDVDDKRDSLSAEIKRRKYPLRIPIDQLDVPGDEIIAAIRRLSGQRFLADQ